MHVKAKWIAATTHIYYAYSYFEILLAVELSIEVMKPPEVKLKPKNAFC